MIQIGATYKHYKGKLYKVIALAKHSETLEDMVVYSAQYAGEFPFGQIWVRPVIIWEQSVNGKPRFELINANIQK